MELIIIKDGHVFARARDEGESGVYCAVCRHARISVNSGGYWKIL